MDDPIATRMRQALSRIAAVPWEGVVYRFVPPSVAPLEPNLRGARWNPPRIPAIYTALDPPTLAAELEYRLRVDQRPPNRPYAAHRIRVRLANVLDLRGDDALAALGVSAEILAQEPPGLTREIGYAAHLMEHDGLLVPSARSRGTNLVIFLGRITTGLVEVLEGAEPI